jgi:acyl-coenzyme A thioesterase PaaI-like protein
MTHLSSHPDFALPWCQSLLASDIKLIENPPGGSDYHPSPGVSNSLFARTLTAPESNAIRRFIMFIRQSASTTAIAISPSEDPMEQCMLVSIGDGADGKSGRAHGGLNALLLDHVLGRTASVSSGSTAPATATMTIDYKAPIDTPGIFLVRCWPISIEGRKVWVGGVIEDGTGHVKAQGKALFIAQRGNQL